MKTKSILALLLVGVMLLSACGSTPSTSGTEASPADGGSPAPLIQESEPSQAPDVAENDRFGGTIKTVLTSDPTTLDPIKGSAVNDQIPGAHIFDTALTADPAGDAFPGVCTYTTSEDGKVITLTVRDGVKFHNGDVCDAADLEASAVRWLANISFAKNYVGAVLDNMKVEGNSLVITLTQPSPLALTAISAWDGGLYVMPKEICEKYPEDQIAPEDYIGTGPYKFVEHLADRYVLLERFADYIPAESDGTGFAAPKMAYADQIQLFVSSDKAATINGIQTGEYDICVSVPANMIPTLTADPKLTVQSREMGIMPTMHFNCEQGPATDINLRNAIIHCLDMEELMLAAQGDESLFLLNPSVLTRSNRWHTDESLDKYNNVDLVKAQEYLDASGYNGETLVFCTTKDNDYFYKTAMLVADMVKPIGIVMDVQVYDNPTLREYRMNPEKYDIFSGGLGSKSDPVLIAFLEDGWAGMYKSERKDALMEQMATEMDFDKRYEAWVELTKVLYEDLPVITFGERTNAIVYSNRLQDVWTTSQQYYWNTWIAE